MRILLILFALAVVLAVLYLLMEGAKAYGRRREAKRRRRAVEGARWDKALRSDNGRVYIEVVKEGCQPVPVAALDPAREGFSEALYEAEARALERAAELNAVDRPKAIGR